MIDSALAIALVIAGACLAAGIVFELSRRGPRLPPSTTRNGRLAVALAEVRAELVQIRRMLEQVDFVDVDVESEIAVDECDEEQGPAGDSDEGSDDEQEDDDDDDDLGNDDSEDDADDDDDDDDGDGKKSPSPMTPNEIAAAYRGDRD